MFIGITLEIEGGRDARIRFSETRDSGAHVRCAGTRECEHELSPAQVTQLFSVIDVPYEGDALEAVRAVVAHQKAQDLFDAIHDSGIVEFPGQESFSWTEAMTTELLELYLTGFTLSMLADHFRIATPRIVRHLSEVMWGDSDLVADSSKPRHQKTWAPQEIHFLITQMQVGRTPTEISALMGRDSLGIAFKLFDALPVPIPRSVLESYGIDLRREPLGDIPLDQPPF